MLPFLKALTILIFFFLEQATSLKSCRQCSGAERITFNTYVSYDQSLAFFRTSLGGCATGNDYLVLVSYFSDCMSHTGPPLCKYWVYVVKIWRYCGNGGRVSLDKGIHCSDNLCAIYDNLSLSCTKSVECRGECTCAQCGC